METNGNKRLIGIYGGTFAPVHNGHIRAARAFLDQINPDKLLIMPALIPPHKQLCDGDDPWRRFDMLNIAFSSFPEFGGQILISDFELRNKGRSYTVNTLEHFFSNDTELVFLLGTDMFLTLDTWYRPERIFELSTIACIMRYEPDSLLRSKLEEQKRYYMEKYNASIVEIKSAITDISSTELRDRLCRGDDVSDFIPNPVIQYIKDNKLYGL